MASYGLARASCGSEETWALLRDEIVHNLQSSVLVRCDYMQHENTLWRNEICALIQTAEVLSQRSDLFRDKTWRQCEEQILFKLDQMHSNGYKLQFHEASALAYAVLRRYPKPVNRKLAAYVETLLLENAKRTEKEDLRLLIHLIGHVCKSDFGTDKFHREFVSLDNLKRLARVENLEFISSHDLRLLIEGLCKLTSQKQQLSFGFANQEENLLYCSSLNLMIQTLLKDIEKLE
jgi:hypothetical protein